MVIPGGADLPYCRELDGKGNTAIASYVRSGGRYLGLCAGGYYGSSRVEFEVGNLELEVSGPRELKFFPGTARGSVFKGFQYGTHVNAKAAKIKADQTTLGLSSESKIVKNSVYSYVDGGCLFVDADKFKSRGVEVLARYLDPLVVKGSDDTETSQGNSSVDEKTPAAAVYCKVGRGCAILTGLHPEFSPELLKRIPSNPSYSSMIQTLENSNQERVEFMKSLLLKMGLKVNPSEMPTPGLSRLYLTSSYPPGLRHLIDTLRNDIGFTGKSHNEFSGTNDQFRIWDASRADQFVMSNNLTEDKDVAMTEKETDETNTSPVDFDKIIKDIEVFYSGLPDNRLTSHFNLKLYYDKLHDLRNALGPGSLLNVCGSIILYGEVVTSTSTMLFKNYKLLKHLPTGLTAVGTTQVAGRGRANNVWVSPPGMLAFSTVLRMPLHNDYGLPSPMVFVQYLAAIAIVDSIRGYARSMLGIPDFPVHIKWPNDVYIVNPLCGSSGSESSSSSTDENQKYFKVSGILVNTTVIDGEYVMVVGIGINVDNAAPSKSLNTMIDELNEQERIPRGHSPYGHFDMESVLAQFMVTWEIMIRDFQYQGFAPFEQTYYDRWLHSNKIVTLEQYGNTKAKIVGISSDFGMLIVEEVDRNEKPIGKRYELQPDGNSFDMLKGLLKKKQ